MDINSLNFLVCLRVERGENSGCEDNDNSKKTKEMEMQRMTHRSTKRSDATICPIQGLQELLLQLTNYKMMQTQLEVGENTGNYVELVGPQIFNKL